ncbi:two-component sensor histidine kinase [Micromonospora ureilytica]|uniref:histidine kinase n=1 Tax=Micromonospora ureilytica TaxID=709868 RepID=A0A3N9XQ44_9ACTN|nr:histidine kinase [Micromonospora ureilytica]RQX15235.1 two-component sensor histidine kinase [Micromonospora ureilytica]
MSTPDLRRWWVRLAQAAGLVAMGLLALFDLRFGAPESLAALLLLLVRMGLAVATVPLWLPVHRLGSRVVPLGALVLACASLAVTAAVLFLSGSSYLIGGSWGLAESAGLIGVVFVVARWGAPRLAPWAAVAAGLAVAALPLRAGTESLLVIFGLLQVLAAAGAAGVGLYLRIMAAGRERAIALVRAEQRAEFARDLHDFIAHHVTGIVVQAQGARFVAEQDPQRVIVALEQIERAGAETMASMRRMVGILRNPDAPPDAPLAPLAGVTELEPLLTGFNGAANAPARLHVDGDLNGLPVEVSTSAYRVVMEGLTNTRQHAPDARSVNVAVRRTPDWLLVRVADDGASPRTAPARGHGFGLIGLTERVRALGGTITAGPGVAGGWVLDAAFPLQVAVPR